MQTMRGLFIAVVVGGIVFFLLTLFDDQLLSMVSVEARAQFSSFFLFGELTISALLILLIYLFIAFSPKATLKRDAQVRELVVANNWFQQIFDKSPVPYLLILSDGRIQRANKAALRLFDLPSDELEGAQLFSKFSKEEGDRVKQLYENFKRSIPIQGEEIQIICVDDKTKWVLFSLFFNESRQGPTGQGLVTLVDVTERKQIEQAKNEFISLASHQLKTPLTTVQWYAEMLLGGNAEPLELKQKRYVNRIHAANRNMIDLVNMLLNISRIEMGTLTPEFRTTDLSVLSDEVAAEFTPLVESRQITLVKDYDKSLSQLQTDPKLLRIIIQNLISNAVKYTPSGGRVTVSVRKEGARVRISVADTGLGIPEEQQDKIFTKLFRADNAMRKDPHGFGLGLYMTKSFVNLLGGTIEFTSDLDKGAVFTVFLPIR